MPEFPRVQVSFFVGDDQWVFRGDSKDDVVAELINANTDSDELLQNLVTFKQKALANTVSTGSGTTNSKRKGSNKGSPPPSNGDSPRCSHGPRTRLDYTKPNGDEVHGWYCCAPKGTPFKEKCDPIRD